ncbi:MAG: bifunctional DNA-formamidopyrimidine glycosylase/DNA-(apurinic or apyrimidinic site) lyase [Acidobacteria bacterium]|nr:bifunctional DNA-formamidopyrimidine glycosylase/DNA-(apurinic or apyrimidinic site) lyase [Acidobacteriota bacterium]
MPEMPEVETIARQLRRRVEGKRIVGVRLSGLPLRKPVSPGLGAALVGRTIRRVRRYGKYLVLTLEPKAFWLIHLGMSGRLLYHEPGRAEGADHTHAAILFSDGDGLEYRDPRRFGLLALYEGASPRAIPEIRSLGKDPLEPGFTGEWLGRRLRGSRREVKSFLLDQGVLAGIGNIYACEALFGARIHPGRRCATLTGRECGRLAAAVQKVMRDAIRRRGTTFSDFRGADGKAGGNQDYLAVYMKEGKQCVECGRPIRRISQGTRSTFFCQQCQR